MTDIKQLLPTNIYQASTDPSSLRAVANASNPFATLADIGTNITSGMIITALGFTPFGGTNPLPIANGGTNAITANAALNNLLPTQTGNAGFVLTTDGTNTSWVVASGGGGGITSLNGLVAASQTFVDDTNVTMVSAVSTHTLTWVGQLAITRGGTNSGSALNNNRVMISSGGAIIEHTAMPVAGTQGAVWYANANGLPTSNSSFTVGAATNNVRIGASGTSSEKLSIVGAGTNTGLGILGAGIAAALQTNSSTLPTLELSNNSGLMTPVSMFNLKNTVNVPTIGSGIYQSFYDQITGPTPEITGQFGVITTDITAGTYKSAFIWNTPNETTGTLVERMRLTSAGFLGILTAAPNSNLHVNGSFATAYTAKTTTYNITASDFTIDCTSGTFTVTLPTAVGITGRIYVIKNSGVGTITLDGNGVQTIDGNLTATLATLQSLTVQSTGANWIII